MFRSEDSWFNSQPELAIVRAYNDNNNNNDNEEQLLP